MAKNDDIPEDSQPNEGDGAESSVGELGYGSSELSEKLEDDLRIKIAELQEQVGAQRDLYVRAIADLENFKKRTQKDREEMRTLMISAIVEDLLPILDHFELGLQAASNHNATDVVIGFKMVFDQLIKILVSYGLSEFCPVNEKFNPHEHDCVRHDYSDSCEEDIITSVVRKGYRLNGKLIRPATVAVATKQQSE